ncbi:MAG: DUF3267 domain-containing protein [Actinobacteria bacterium]|nr:DUF3267 domain-containing protein [Actinomycetota bacterium]MCG2808659.1 DUF3267 domain-containing protein [Coriobacteriia bacterium]
MRFHLGSVPDDAEFDPEMGSWTRLKEPRFGWMMLMVLPVSVLVVAALSSAWSVVLRMYGAPSALEGVVTPAVAGLLLLGCAAIILVHETIHLLALPRLGLTADTVLGFWPQTLTPYVSFEGETSRARQIAVGLAPFLALSVAPLLTGVLFGWAPLWVVAVSLLNGLGASADLVGVVLVVWQVPKRGRVRNKGLATWWRTPA